MACGSVSDMFSARIVLVELNADGLSVTTQAAPVILGQGDPSLEITALAIASARVTTRFLGLLHGRRICRPRSPGDICDSRRLLERCAKKCVRAAPSHKSCIAQPDFSIWSKAGPRTSLIPCGPAMHAAGNGAIGCSPCSICPQPGGSHNQAKSADGQKDESALTYSMASARPSWRRWSCFLAAT